MKKVFQAWCEEEDGRIVSTTLGTVDNIQEQFAKGLLNKNCRLIYEFQADTFEEALAVHHIKMGWKPYYPEGAPQKCPNGCGAIFYPEGSGDCPNCDHIC